ncbi:MAG: signal recognition particle-docking protein FtsY [candidate division Zixibacteria bacterium RBG_16_40_9]|nr:MAG: signal recognition particle-docking protein FtsY [candidate division Zixibacteria bacterium RBG_16_40_9]
MALFSKLKSGLAKTKANFVDKIASAVGIYKRIDADLLSSLEKTLLEADVGVTATEKILNGLKEKVKQEKIETSDKVLDLLKGEISHLLDSSGLSPVTVSNSKPWVIMIVGVNGNGKTTSIGKLAHFYQEQGKKVLVAACDTFRAAAIEQLEIWAKRAQAEIVKTQPNADPAAVAFDAIKSAVSQNLDVVIADTAGRLQTKVNLMEELKKIKKVMGKALPQAPHEILLVIDSTTGQNAISQVKLFSQAVDITGIILTKLDGTAKGGIIIPIVSELKIPIKYVGVGEKIDDLELFEPQEFVEALFSD